MAKQLNEKIAKAAKERRKRPLATPTDLSSAATRDISAALNQILADVFALYLKTKNFHWHVSGPHFRDYHLLLDEQGRRAVRHDGSAGRAHPQDRRHHAALHRPHRPHPAHPGQ